MIGRAAGTGVMGLFLGLLLTLAALGPASAQTCPRDAAAELDNAVSQTIAAVRNGDSRALLAMVGEDGLSLGPEGNTLAYRTLQVEFAGKTGRYCNFFVCGGRRGDVGEKFRSGRIDKQIDSRNGLATVFINANSNDELHLNYRLRDCRWKLTGVATVE